MNIRHLSAKFQQEKDLSGYWAHLKPDKNLTGEEEEKWKTQAAFLDAVSSQNRVALMLWNAFSNRFVFVSDKWEILGGHTPEQYTGENGMSFWLSNIHPDHLDASLLTNEKGVHFFNTHPEIPVSDVLISVSQCLKKKNGQCFEMLQQSTIVETDGKGQPLLVLSYISDISHLKKPHCSDMVIAWPGFAEIYSFDFETKTLGAAKSISGKEMDILKLLSRGLDSKKIADTLHLSPNTVDTHRRNLIKKTNCIDTTAVVSYARRTGII